MLRRLAFWVFLFLIGFSPLRSAAQAASSTLKHMSSEAAIAGVIAQQKASWNRGDLEAFMAAYWNSPELTFFSSGTVSRGWQSALDHYRKSYQGAGHEMGTLDFPELNVEKLSSDSAFVRGEWKLTMRDGKTSHGLTTLIFRKFPEGWRIIHDHSSIADDSAAASSAQSSVPSQ